MISGKVRVMSAPFRLSSVTAPLSTIAMPRWPSYFASTAKSLNGSGGRPSVASIGKGLLLIDRESRYRWQRLTESAGQILELGVQLAKGLGECAQPFGEELGRRVVGDSRDLAELVAGCGGPGGGVAHER